MADNQLTIRARLIDEISQPAARARQALAQVGATAKNEALGGVKAFGAGLKDGAGQARAAAAEADKAGTSIKGAGAEMERGAKSGFNFGGALKTLAGGFAIIGGANMIKNAMSLGISTAAANEQAQISFTTLLKSADKAKTFVGDLKTFAAKTPFDMPGLQDSAAKLLATGVNADKVIPIMTTLGNVTSGMGTGAEGIGRATVAIQQMNAAGRISGQDLNQLRDAGIPVYDLLAAATGKSAEAVAELASKGKLGKKELTAMMDALTTGKGLERFNGLMEKQSESLQGKWDSFKENVANTLGTWMEPLLPGLKNALGGAETFLQDFPEKVSTFFAPLGHVWDGLKAIWDSSLSPLVEDVKGILGGIFESDAVSTGGDIVTTIFEKIGWVLKVVADNADLTKSAVVALAGGFAAYQIVQTVTTLIHLFRTAILLSTAAMKALNATMKANVVMIIVTAIAALIAGLVYFFTQTETGKKAWAAFTEFMGKAWDKLKELLIAGWNSFVERFNQGKDVLAGIWNAIVTVFNFVKDKLIGYFNFVVLVWTTVWKGIIAGKDALVTAWNAMVTFFQTFVLNPLIAYFNLVISFWTAVWNGIKAGAALINEAFWTIVNKVKDVYDGIVKWLTDAVEWVKGLPQKIVDGLTGLAEKLHEALVKPFEDAAKEIRTITEGITKGAQDIVSGVNTNESGAVRVGLQQSGAVGGLVAQVADWFGGAGDTATSMSRAGSIANTIGAYRAASAASGTALGVSNVWVGGGGKGYGSGDHQHGRALDLIGSTGQMRRFMSTVRSFGDYAAIHGSGPSAHVHYVPAQRALAGAGLASLASTRGPMGDTASSMASGLTIHVGQVVLQAADGTDAADKFVQRLRRYQAESYERS